MGKITWISKQQKGKNDIIEFLSPINSENSFTSTPLAKEARSTMELFHNQGNSSIEWIVEDLDIVEHIGLWFTGKELTDYDGVFSLPQQAITMLRELGFTVSKEFEDK